MARGRCGLTGDGPPIRVEAANSSQGRAAMAKWKRYVVGPNATGKSAVLMQEATNVQEDPGIYYRATLWSAAEVPVNNSIANDRSLDVTTREPPPGGMLCRALEIPPDPPDRTHHIEAVKRLHAQVKQKHQPTEVDLARHPS